MYSDVVPSRTTPNEIANLLKRASSPSSGLPTTRAPPNRPERLTQSPETVKSASNGDDINSESDSESQPGEDAKPRKMSERRRIQNAKFTSWLVEAVLLAFATYLLKSCRLSRRAEHVTKEEVKATIQATDIDDEALSIRNLMSKQESNVIITDPREYQTELFEKAKKQNIIAVLDTGMSNIVSKMRRRH